MNIVLIHAYNINRQMHACMHEPTHTHMHACNADTHNTHLCTLAIYTHKYTCRHTHTQVHIYMYILYMLIIN